MAENHERILRTTCFRLRASSHHFGARVEAEILRVGDNAGQNRAFFQCFGLASIVPSEKKHASVEEQT
jgi:hypothetical protein